MATEMKGLWVGPMPVNDFLGKYVPLKPDAKPPPQPLDLYNTMPVGKGQEKKMYSHFMELVDKHKLVPGFKIVDTSNHPDNSSTGSAIRPDPTMYRCDLDVTGKVTQFAELELHFEFKPTDDHDPFDDPPNGITSEQRQEWAFETSRVAGTSCRGQLGGYVTEWCSRQHRKWAFSVYIGGEYARLICWDRSAAVVTEKFDLHTNSQALVDFLWRFCQLSDGERGRDETVRSATKDEEILAEEKLSEWKNAKDRPVIVLTIWDGVLEKLREFIAWGSMANAGSLTGRCTRAYPVYEKATGKTCFLKDTWRAATLERESDILKELNTAGVRNVPQLICGGDIAGHVTRSHLYATEDADGTVPLNESYPWICGIIRVTKRIHHRFTEDFIGVHLDKFTSSKEMMTIVYDAFIGHYDAFTKCGILHRDVSGKNIMMQEGGRGGILNDWDLAKRTTSLTPRRHERTGTWQFISTLNLMITGKAHEVQDDLESFILVVLYHALRYGTHNKIDDLPAILKHVFDHHVAWSSHSITGGEGKQGMFMHMNYIGRDFEITNNPPLNFWISFALNVVKQFLEPKFPGRVDDYSQITDELTPLAPMIQKPLLLDNHEALMKAWTLVLARTDWPVHDKAVDRAPKPSKALSRNSKRVRESIGAGEQDSEAFMRSKKQRSTSAVASGSRTGQKD